MLLRIDSSDAGTVEDTSRACADAVTELAGRSLVAMVEPLPYRARETDGSLRMLEDVPSLARAVAIASGLGTTSAYTWLKMPSCDDPEAVFDGDDAALRGARAGFLDADPAKDLESWVAR